MKNRKIIKTVMVSLAIILCTGVNAQRSRQYFSYGNIQGVKRYGLSVNYFADYGKGGGIDYLKIHRNRNYVKYTLQYRERNAQTEDVMSLHLQLSYGNHLQQFGRRTFIRFLIGPELGYEKKTSLLMDEKREFMFGGIHAGLEIEYFLSRRLVFFVSGVQYGHVYMRQVRTDYLINSGLRLSIL